MSPINLFYRFADNPLAPSDYKQLNDRRFSSYASVIASAGTWLNGKLSDFFFEWLAKLRVWSL